MRRILSAIIIVFLAVACARGVIAPAPSEGTLLPPTATPEPTSTPGPPTPTSALKPAVPLEPAPSMMRYSSPALGFAVEYPYGWEVTIITPSGKDSLGRPYEAVEFVSDLYAGGHQAFGRYRITVAACPAVGMETITDTVEYALTPLSQTMRDQLKRRYLTVAGEPALELTSFPWERFGSRKIWVVHNELEYTLNFRPYMDFYTPSDTKARAAFDAFLRTFAFIPITETPSWQIPTPTPVPTPTSVPCTANLVCVSGNLSVSGSRLYEPWVSLLGLLLDDCHAS